MGAKFKIQIDDEPEIVVEYDPGKDVGWPDWNRVHEAVIIDDCAMMSDSDLSLAREFARQKQERLRRGTFFPGTFKDMYPLADDDEIVIS